MAVTSTADLTRRQASYSPQINELYSSNQVNQGDPTTPDYYAPDINQGKTEISNFEPEINQGSINILTPNPVINQGSIEIIEPDVRIEQGSTDIIASNPIIEQGEIEVKPFNPDIVQGETNVRTYDPDIEQGSTTPQPFNIEIEQGKTDPIIPDPEINQGRIDVAEFNPTIEQGQTTPDNFNPTIEQGETTPLPFVPNIEQGETDPVISNPDIEQGETTPSEFNPDIVQGETSPIAFNPEIEQGESDPVEFNPVIEQGETSPVLFAPVIEQGETDAVPFNPEIEQGETTPILFAPEIEQGESTPAAFEPEIEQGEITPTPWNPEIEQGEATPVIPDPDITQGETTPVPFDPTITQGETTPIPFEPTIEQGETDPLPFPPSQPQPGVTPRPFVAIINQGSIRVIRPNPTIVQGSSKVIRSNPNIQQGSINLSRITGRNILDSITFAEDQSLPLQTLPIISQTVSGLANTNVPIIGGASLSGIVSGVLSATNPGAAQVVSAVNYLANLPLSLYRRPEGLILIGNQVANVAFSNFMTRKDQILEGDRSSYSPNLDAMPKFGVSNVLSYIGIKPGEEASFPTRGPETWQHDSKFFIDKVGISLGPDQYRNNTYGLAKNPFESNGLLATGGDSINKPLGWAQRYQENSFIISVADLEYIQGKEYKTKPVPQDGNIIEISPNGSIIAEGKGYNELFLMSRPSGFPIVTAINGFITTNEETDAYRLENLNVPSWAESRESLGLGTDTPFYSNVVGPKKSPVTYQAGIGTVYDPDVTSVINNISPNGGLLSPTEFVNLDNSLIQIKNNELVPNPPSVDLENKYESYVNAPDGAASTTAQVSRIPYENESGFSPNGGIISTEDGQNTSKTYGLINSNIDGKGIYSTLRYKQIADRAQLSKDGVKILPDFRNDLENQVVKPTDTIDTKKVLDTFRFRLSNDNASPVESMDVIDPLMDSVDATTDADFVKVIFKDLRSTGTTTQFRSYISNFSDKFNPTFTDVNYIGRPNPLKIFSNTSRDISMDLMVPSFSRGELKTMYAKLNRLANLAMPSNVGVMIGPTFEFTLGDYFDAEICHLSSLAFNVDDDYPWEINIEGSTDVAVVPHFIKVSLGIYIIGKNAMTTAGYKVFGSRITS